MGGRGQSSASIRTGAGKGVTLSVREQGGKGLRPRALAHLPLGAVKPLGWLRAQLEAQADGLTGHLDEFWMTDDWWRGGEGKNPDTTPAKIHNTPNYLEGLIPLAYLLDDARLIAKLRPYVDTILGSGRGNGWFGPEPGDASVAILARARCCRALIDYAEATGDRRPADLMERYILRYAANDPPMDWLSDVTFQEHLVPALWLHDTSGNPALLGAAARIASRPSPDGHWEAAFRGLTRDQHQGYGIAHGLKYPGLLWRLNGDPAFRDAGQRLLAWLDEHYGQVGGRYAAHEWLPKEDGRRPTHGTELCDVVEMMYSLEQLMEVTGDPALGDRLEALAFNALPGTLTADFWAHQYDQQANQVLVSVADRGFDNTPTANLYGLAPNYTCCLANLHQGFPRYVKHLWMALPGNGLAAAAYGPCRVCATLPAGGIAITEDTEYPFDGRIRLRIDVAPAAPVALHLRIPAWAGGAECRHPGGRLRPDAGAFARIERAWRPGDTVELDLPMRIRLETRHRGAVSVLRGPLAFALRIGAEYVNLSPDRDFLKGFPGYDWEIRPTTPWNYALAPDPSAGDAGFTVRRNPVPSLPWVRRGEPVHRPAGAAYARTASAEDAAVVLEVRGRRLPGWGMHPKLASADDPPVSPVAAPGPDQPLELVPYGCTRLRIAEFPVAKPG